MTDSKERPEDWPFDAATFERPEVRAAIAEDRAKVGEVTVSAAQATELLGRRARRMSLRKVAEELGRARAVREIACGLHSGFPPCCVRFFVQTWLSMSAKDLAKYHATFESPGWWNHQVPCPECVRIKRFVTAKACDCAERFAALVARAAGGGPNDKPSLAFWDRWPFSDPAMMQSKEIKAAVAEFYDAFGDITIAATQALALLGRRRTRIGDDELVTLRRVAQLLEGDAHTIACGLHSGFPTCCIRFFIETWSPMPLTEKREHRAAIDALGVTPWYIPCRVCVRARRFVELRRCDCGARRDAAIVETARRLRGY